MVRSAPPPLRDGVETPIDIVFQSTGQINVRLLHKGAEHDSGVATEPAAWRSAQSSTESL